MRNILLVLISICSVTWLVWPFVFVGTLAGQIRRVADTAQEQRGNRLIAWGFAAGFSLLMVCVSVVTLAGMIM